jgi:hypothetical protein
MCKNSIFSRVTPVVPREPLSDDMVEELLAA